MNYLEKITEAVDPINERAEFLAEKASNDGTYELDSADEREFVRDLLHSIQVDAQQMLFLMTNEAPPSPWPDGPHYIPGSVLKDKDDPRLSQALDALHTATWGWPQRPGSLGAHDLLTYDYGGDIDLSSMPPQLVNQIRAAWSALPSSHRCVVHGDAGPGNAVISSDGQCVLIDFDEARVDNPTFDTGATPQDRRAQLAWEIATCWHLEPRYAQSLVPRFLSQ